MHGQQEIHQKIKQLNFRDCKVSFCVFSPFLFSFLCKSFNCLFTIFKAKIRQVDAHATLASGVVVQVLGELSNNNKPMRRFMQTFVLGKYYKVYYFGKKTREINFLKIRKKCRCLFTFFSSASTQKILCI